MNIILDVILIAIFAAIVFAAVKKGFMLSLLELVAVIAALVLAFQLSPVVSQAAYDGIVEKSLIETVETQIDETLSLSETGTQAEVILNAIPGFMVDFASSAGIEVKEIKAKISSTLLTILACSFTGNPNFFINSKDSHCVLIP